MIATLRESSDEALRGFLEQALAETRGAPTDVVELSRRPFAYETSYALDALDLRLVGGEELRLLAKDVGARGLSATAAVAKPPFLIDPAREIAVYRDLLAPATLSTPHFHGAAIDAAEGRWWLFLERIDGEVLTDVGETSIWQQAAAWAARLGSAVPDRRPAALDALLVHRDATWHSRWIDAALAAVGEPGQGSRGRAGLDRSPAGDAAARLAERLPVSCTPLLERLDALPQAFVHGELYASNVVVERCGDGPVRIAPVDWELAGTGPYVLDLAALVSGWADDERLAMCRAFHDSLAAERRADTTFEQLLEAVDFCRLALALQWIGWAPGWRAPEAHRHDWVAEAAELLDKVGLP